MRRIAWAWLGLVALGLIASLSWAAHDAYINRYEEFITGCVGLGFFVAVVLTILSLCIVLPED